MNADSSAYGLWGLVIINSLFFIAFAFSFYRPRTQRDWRSARNRKCSQCLVRLIETINARPRPFSRA